MPSADARLHALETALRSMEQHIEAIWQRIPSQGLSHKGEPEDPPGPAAPRPQQLPPRKLTLVHRFLRWLNGGRS